MRYSGKPLTSSKGGVQRQPDLKQMMIWGNLMDADKAARGADRSDAEAPSMVPASWQLIRRAGDGVAPGEMMAKGVQSFDISPDGEVCYSNGNALYRRPAAQATGSPRGSLSQALLSMWLGLVK